MSAVPDTVRIIRVFVSSPGDVQAERDVLDDAIDFLNRTTGQPNGFHLELFRWERDATPQIGPKPQEVVDARTPAYHIYLGIMSTRFGTPTDHFGSGTEEEFREALENWRDVGSPWIVFYFDDAPKRLRKKEEREQHDKVCDFRDELETCGIVCAYEGIRGHSEAFYDKVLEHLHKIMNSLIQPKTPHSTRVGGSAKPTVPPMYTEWLLSRCGEVELMGLDIKHGVGVRLNNVYTPLTTSARLDKVEKGKRRTTDELMDEDRESTQLLLALLDKQSLYVSGDPGSGKSTFCRWVTWLACKGEMPKADVSASDKYSESFPEQLRGRLPVLVRLRDFWQHLPAAGVDSLGMTGLVQALEGWLAAQSCPGLDWPCLRAHLEQGSALVMLDGVDEVPSVRPSADGEWFPRAMLLTGLADGAGRWNKAGNRLLVTSRPYGLDSEQQRKLHLQSAPILGLDQELQALLVRRWFVRLKEGFDLGLKTADAMIDHILVQRGLDDLAANPLLLTAMCIIYDEGKRLPHDKYTLYDRIVDTVLHKRYAGRERIDPIRGRLAAVASGMHTGEGLGQQRVTPEAIASDREIDAILQAYQQLDGATDKGLSDTVRVREDLLSQSGVLVSRGDGKASFYHLSIQEFLTAERLHLLYFRKWDGLIGLITERGASSAWRNTLSFLFGCLLAKSSPHVGIECLQEITGRLTLLTSEKSLQGQGLPDSVWNLAIVLGDCLQTLVGRESAIPEDLITSFQRCVFQAIQQEDAVEDRHALAVALGHLGDPRIEVDLRIRTHPDKHPGYVNIPRGKYCIGDEKNPITIDRPFWLSKYPVTNSQYALFIEDHGYSRQEFWSDEGWQWLESEGMKTPGYWRNSEFNAPNQPVVAVTWWEAEAFCKWAGVRLPKADEAEAAARGSLGSKYPWGDSWEAGICNSHEARLGSTSAVGIFPRDCSPFGVMDMAGNVWEWCDDGDASDRVSRGGSWSNQAGSAVRRIVTRTTRRTGMSTWAFVWPQFHPASSGKKQQVSSAFGGG